MSAAALLNVTVVVLSYRRPEELSRALPIITAQAEECNRDPRIDASVLIVDNDPAGSAEETVRKCDSPLVRYVIEPTPGIAAARNRGLLEARRPGLLVFIDDDEAPMDNWLRPLLETWRQTQAAAVMGKVISQFEQEPDPWIIAGDFFWRPTRVTGTPVRVAAAGNLLLDLRQVDALGLSFDDRYGLSGGEDTLFSKQLIQRGGSIVWCEESKAIDFVPLSRSTRGWVIGRSRSAGNTTSTIDIQLASSGRARFLAHSAALAAGCGRVVGGSLRCAAGLVTRSLRHQARGLRTVNRGIGMIAAGVGIRFQEYARDD
ncbi:MAG: glycosyltransferase [Lacisediminihabitans sp.]